MIKKIALACSIFMFGCSERGEFFGAKIVSRYMEKGGALCAKAIGWNDVQTATNKKQYCICMLPSPEQITEKDTQQLSDLYKIGRPIGIRQIFLVDDSFCNE